MNPGCGRWNRTFSPKCTRVRIIFLQTTFYTTRECNFVFQVLGILTQKSFVFFCEHRTQVLANIYLHNVRFLSGISIPCFWWVDGGWVEEGAGLIGGSGPIGTYHVGVPAFRKGWMTVKLNVPAFRNAGTQQNLMFQPSERLEHCKTKCSSLLTAKLNVPAFRKEAPGTWSEKQPAGCKTQWSGPWSWSEIQLAGVK